MCRGRSKGHQCACSGQLEDAQSVDLSPPHHNSPRQLVSLATTMAPFLTVSAPATRSSSPTPVLSPRATRASSRSGSPSPTPPPERPGSRGYKIDDDVHKDQQPVGLLDDKAMAALLPAWRLRMRAVVARNVDREMPYLLWIQVRGRSSQ